MYEYTTFSSINLLRSHVVMNELTIQRESNTGRRSMLIVEGDLLWNLASHLLILKRWSTGLLEAQTFENHTVFTQMILTASWKLPEQFLEAQGANSSAGAFSVFCNIISVVNLFFFFFIHKYILIFLIMVKNYNTIK